MREVRVVGRAITAAFNPIKLNYDILGNAVPICTSTSSPATPTTRDQGGPFPSRSENRRRSRSS